tara:strand:+ start:548 stop:763 length:216 start_codon:yes stop_codon:yes gene_type:complete
MNYEKLLMAGVIGLIPLGFVSIILLIISFGAWSLILPDLFILRVCALLGVGCATYFWFDTDEFGTEKEKSE